MPPKKPRIKNIKQRKIGKTYRNARIPKKKQEVDHMGAVIDALEWLRNSNKEKKYLFVQNRNLGDTLHLTPIIHHYRTRFPDAAMAFIVGNPYNNAHVLNPHIDKLFSLPLLGPQERIRMRERLLKEKDIRLVMPSIFPHGEVWRELRWDGGDIATQYIKNAGINPRDLLVPRKLIVKVHDSDNKWAEDFIKKHGINPKKACVIEYNSYSHPNLWAMKEYKEFASRLKNNGFSPISVCGPNEHIIPGTISAQGITWRQTVALMNIVSLMAGCGSGNTMLAAAAENPPIIGEILISPTVTMKECGYADSIRIVNKDPVIVADHFSYKLLK